LRQFACYLRNRQSAQRNPFVFKCTHFAPYLIKKQKI
jgi:VanZ family protein